MRFKYFLIAVGFTVFAIPAFAQGETDEVSVSESADTIGAALINEFDASYDVVFDAIKSGLESNGYKVDYSSKRRNLIETAFKILVDPDSDEGFYDIMEPFGEIPYIRSPGWTVGRTKVSVTLEKIGDSKTGIRVLAIVSGYEGRFTNKWHYWKSNGKIEQQALDIITQAVESAAG